MVIQTLERTSKFITHYLAKHPNCRLKTLYKLIRQRNDATLFGDYPLIAEIVFQAVYQHRFFTAKDVVKTFRLTADPQLAKQRSDSNIVSFLTNKVELEA